MELLELGVVADRVEVAGSSVVALLEKEVEEIIHL
jgi:hypothetical protein